MNCVEWYAASARQLSGLKYPRRMGGVRQLGIPALADRIVQTLVKQALEPELEKHFHPASYGYRPGKSARKAPATARESCWRYDGVVELDVKGYFENIAHNHLDARGAPPHPGKMSGAVYRAMLQGAAADGRR
jgi:retron-type reverse transcriptase